MREIELRTRWADPKSKAGREAKEKNKEKNNSFTIEILNNFKCIFFILMKYCYVPLPPGIFRKNF